ncbi:MarR family transcriptional regulator [Pseudomonas sp. WN033]|nr:MarR family transcriptional regulator [Pseudomonas sp. WN033]
MSSPSHLHLRNQICLALYSAGNALSRAYRPLLEPLDLTYPQYLVMLALWEEDGVSVTAICERTRLDTGTVTPLLKRLEAKGLLLRVRSAEDERRRVISLTDSGRALQARAEDIPLRMACLGVLTPAEGAELKRLSETLYRNLLALEQLRASSGDNQDGLAG